MKSDRAGHLYPGLSRDSLRQHECCCDAQEGFDLLTISAGELNHERVLECKASLKSSYPALRVCLGTNCISKFNPWFDSRITREFQLNIPLYTVQDNVNRTRTRLGGNVERVRGRRIVRSTTQLVL